MCTFKVQSNYQNISIEASFYGSLLVRHHSIILLYCCHLQEVAQTQSVIKVIEAFF